MDGVRAAVVFEGVIRQAIHDLKYQGRTELAVPLAELMVEAWESGLFPVDCLVPVPLHPRRLRERGYNQANFLTEGFAEKIKLPVLLGVLARSRMTKSQTKLGVAERRKNVKGAFTAIPAVLEGRSVLLVDDVCTSGFTLQACADALRTAGAVQVYAMTVARAGWGIHKGDADQSCLS